VLAHLPAAQVRALFPTPAAFVDRHGTGPTSLSTLRSLLTETRQRGYAVETGQVTPGLSSVAVAVLDHNDFPLAGVAVTYAEGDADPAALATDVRRTARTLSTRLGGRR
jgi:DNA-binding IclR family transcriptional regulator